MIKNILIDVDGVIWHGGKLIAGAKETLEFLEKNKYNYLFLTNISRYTKKELSSKFRTAGIKASIEKFLTPIEATIHFIKSKKPNAVCYLISEPAIKTQFRKSGLKVIEKEGKADFVVVFLFEKTDYAMLNTAFRKTSAGAQLVSNSDLKSMAFHNETPSLAAGAFVKGLEYCTGKKAILTGKPSKNFFESARKRLCAKKSETIMVGDTISIDIAGAKAAGIRSALVKTGNYSPKELKKSNIKPDSVIESIAGLPKLLQKKKW